MPEGQRKRKTKGTRSGAMHLGEDVFLMTMIALRTGLAMCLISSWFGCEENDFSYPFRMIVGRIAGLGSIFMHYPNLEESQARLIDKYKSVYGTDHLRSILDCFEIRIPKATNQKMARKQYSTYKHNYTAKILVGLHPGGHILFCSEAYPGSIDDNSLVSYYLCTSVIVSPH